MFQGNDAFYCSVYCSVSCFIEEGAALTRRLHTVRRWRTKSTVDRRADLERRNIQLDEIRETGRGLVVQNNLKVRNQLHRLNRRHRIRQEASTEHEGSARPGKTTDQAGSILFSRLQIRFRGHLARSVLQNQYETELTHTIMRLESIAREMRSTLREVYYKINTRQN